MQACAPCHGANARGRGPVAAALVRAPADLTSLRARHGAFPRDELVAVLSGEREIPDHGTREMPAWNQRFAARGAPGVAAVYARRRLELLTGFLESIQNEDAGSEATPVQ
ncbi:MAG: hypothetical protein HY699_08695 [Deltaproteobacteria bacterium]|nr:hypothetical protein [Deltaproteobacteria bacterium]